MTGKNLDIFLNNLKNRLNMAIKEGMTQEEIKKEIDHAIGYQFSQIEEIK